MYVYGYGTKYITCMHVCILWHIHMCAQLYESIQKCGIQWACVRVFLCEIRYYHREYHCHLRYTDIIPYGYPTYLLGGCSYKNSYVATKVITPNVYHAFLRSTLRHTIYT